MELEMDLEMAAELVTALEQAQFRPLLEGQELLQLQY